MSGSEPSCAAFRCVSPNSNAALLGEECVCLCDKPPTLCVRGRSTARPWTIPLADIGRLGNVSGASGSAKRDCQGSHETKIQGRRSRNLELGGWPG